MTGRQIGRPSRPGPSARSVALEAIRRVIDERAYSTLVVPALLGRSGLDARDRAFATELAYGTLRRRIPIDHAIEAQATRPLNRMGPVVRHALRLGAYQLSFTAVPAHAAVSETVSLVAPRERGFVNAILRGLATHPWSPSTGSDVDAISLRTGLAAWAVRELEALIGDEAEAAAEAFARRGPLCLRTNTERTDVASLERALRPPPRSIPIASCSTEAIRPPFPGTGKGGSPSRTKPRCSSCASSIRDRGSGSSTSAPLPAARPSRSRP
jgi:16S rRNA (cytosine967-C5)-methyltransferase